ncbi:MAG: phage tail P2-like protein [Rickettsiales bacterium]|jgi:phage tail P2-like protein
MSSDTKKNTLLPLNVTDLLKDLESSSLRATNLEALNQYVLSPNQAPEHILPWLAFAVSVDDWSDNWSDEVKRNVIKASVGIHQIKGTIGALRSALEAFDYENIVAHEWFDYDGQPHFFRVFFDITKEGFSTEDMPEVVRAIDNSKNARSHLEELRATLLAEITDSYVVSTIISKEVSEVSNF